MIFGEGPIIKNIAGDLNKLFLQGSRVNHPINNVEGDAAADQATIQLMADRDPVIRDISTGLGWAGREVTVSGTGALQLVNSLGRPLKRWSAELGPYQDLNGYDSPWPAGGGKNKYNTADTAWSEGTVILDNNGNPTTSVASHYTTNYTKVVPSTSYTLSGTIVYGTTLTGRIYFYDSDKHWISRTSAMQFDDADGVQFTTPATCEYIQIQTASETTVDWMLEIGSTLSVWEPYSNICPIYGTDKLNLFVEESYDPTATPKAVITLPQTIYSGSVSDDGAVSAWGNVDLGTLRWYDAIPESHIFRTDIVDMKAPGATDYPARAQGLMCEQYRPDTQYGINTNMHDCSMLKVSTSLYIRNNQYTSASDFSASLSGVKLIYELATPATLTLTTPDIPTPIGNATAWATAEDGIVTSFSATYLEAE